MALNQKLSAALSIILSVLLLFNRIPCAVGHGEGGHEEGGTELDCSSYINTIDLPSGKIEYVSDATTISFRMSSTKNDGYLSLGFSENGMMDGSEVVVGDDEGVSLYSLIGHTARKIVDETKQAALSDESFLQDDNGSVLEFRKLLDDGTDNNKVIDGNGKNILIWSIGYTNNIFVGHGTNRGSIPLTLTPCSKGGKATELTYEEKNTKNLFLVHGIFAIVAFAVCMPIAIAAVTARSLFMKDGLWFKIHSFTMGLASAITIALFTMSVYSVNQKGSSHFHNAHGIIGLIITLALTIHVVFAVMRPSSHLSPKSAHDTDYDTTEEAGTIEKDENLEDEEKVEKTLLRIVWERVHRLLGLVIVIAGFYQIHSGLVIYKDLYATKDYIMIFWIVTGVLLSILAGVIFYSKKK